MPLVTSGALHGLLESLDPMSSYLTPREYADYKQKSASGVKGEIGVTLSKRFGYIVVLSVLPESPAQKAGLRTADILEAISGFTTREMSIGQAHLLLAGNPGTAVKIAVVRRGSAEPHDVDVVRAQILAPKLVTDKLENDIGYIKMPALETGMAAELRDKLLQFEKQGLHKLVLDLRDCGRGQASEAVAAARLFLSSGKITTLRGQTVTKQEFEADPAKVVWRGPMTVLISVSTSGPAEVLAAAIGGNNRGQLVGERTLGLASEQKLIPLDDGAALFLTVAFYYTPAGKSIGDDGVPPTVEVRASNEDATDGADEDSGAQADGPPVSRVDDPVIRKAIELLTKGDTHKAQVLRPAIWRYLFAEAA
jgi:carboxyl-terminal processing protease